MFSLKTILLAATAALAGVAIAAPALTSSEPAALLARGECKCDTIPLILHNVIDQCAVISVDLKVKIAAAVKVLGKVDVSVVAPAINAVVDVVAKAVVQIKAIAKLDLKVILLDGGVLLSVSACAALVVKVIVAICAILKICLDAVIVLQITACLTLILKVSVAIIALLDILIIVVVGIKVEIVAYLTAHLDIIALIKACGLLNVLIFLGIGL